MRNAVNISPSNQTALKIHGELLILNLEILLVQIYQEAALTPLNIPSYNFYIILKEHER